MSMLDEILGGVREVTDNVVERTGKLVDVSKLRLTSAEISKEVTRRYEALGRLVYDSRKSNTEINGLIDECVRSIDALYGRMDDVNSRIAKLRDKQYCETCGATVERGAIYCARCGCRMKNKKDAQAETDNTQNAASDFFSEEKAEDVVVSAAEAAEDIAEKAAETVKETVESIVDSVAQSIETENTPDEGVPEEKGSEDAAD